MKIIRNILLITALVSIVQPVVSDKPNICKCPNYVEGAEYPFVMCGKELNFINRNQHCEMEVIYRCKVAGKETEKEEVCGKDWVCGRDFGICLSKKTCHLEKFDRVCYAVEASKGQPSGKCRKMYYELDDKGKLCCDKVPDKLPAC